MEIGYVIKCSVKGVWQYYDGSDRSFDRDWMGDIYQAKKFETEQEAEQFLKDRMVMGHWGGYFQIEKYFLNR